MSISTYEAIAEQCRRKADDAACTGYPVLAREWLEAAGAAERLTHDIVSTMDVAALQRAEKEAHALVRSVAERDDIAIHRVLQVYRQAVENRTTALLKAKIEQL